MTAKLIFLLALSIVMGLVFMGIGLYFMSKKFLSKINQASPLQSEEVFKKNSIRSKGAGYVSLSLGVITEIWGIILFCYPQFAGPLALIYMIFLILAFVFLTFVFK